MRAVTIGGGDAEGENEEGAENGSWQECQAPVPSGLQPHDKTQTASKRRSASSFTGLSLQ